MARSRLTDFLNVSKFHVLDVSFEVPPVLIPIYGFRSVSLPSLNLELREIQQGNYEFPNKVMKGAKVSNMVLEQGVSLFNSDFYNWTKNAITGDAAPRNLVVVQFTNINPKPLVTKKSNALVQAAAGALLGGFPYADGTRLPGRAWLCRECRPVRYTPGSDFDASSGEISIAKLELAMMEFEEFSFGL